MLSLGKINARRSPFYPCQFSPFCYIFLHPPLPARTAQCPLQARGYTGTRSALCDTPSSPFPPPPPGDAFPPRTWCPSNGSCYFDFSQKTTLNPPPPPPCASEGFLCVCFLLSLDRSRRARFAPMLCRLYPPAPRFFSSFFSWRMPPPVAPFYCYSACSSRRQFLQPHCFTKSRRKQSLLPESLSFIATPPRFYRCRSLDSFLSNLRIR